MASLKLLLDCLQAAQSPELTYRKRAEDELRKGVQQPGFGIALVQVAVDQQIAIETRQAAALLLKQLIKNHWTAEMETFTVRPPLRFLAHHGLNTVSVTMARGADKIENHLIERSEIQEPVVGEKEKDAIRKQLPQGLADPSSKMRTAVSMAVVSIAKWDIPEAWPTLIEDLLSAIMSRQGTALISGAVRCLSMLVDEVDEEQTVQMIPALLPELLRILQQPQVFEPSVQRRAVSTMRGLVANCSNAMGNCKVQARVTLIAHLQAWVQQFCEILGQQQKPASRSNVGALKMEVLKTLILLFSTYGKQMQPAASLILHSCWSLLTDSFMLYQGTVIESASSDDGEADSEGDTLNLSSLVAQLFEFLLTLAASKRYQSLLSSHLKELVYVSIGYLQITNEQEGAWSQDVNLYVSEEDELVFAVRTSASLLLDELFTAFPGAAAVSLSGALQQRFQEAEDLKRNCVKSWWKLREAGLTAVCSTSERLLEDESRQQFQVAALLDNVMQQDFGGGVNGFLQSRAFSVTAKLADALDPQRIAAVLQTATAGLTNSKTPVVQVGACRAIAELAAKARAEDLGQVLQSIYMGLGGLLSSLDDESLGVALEALDAVIKAAPEAAAGWQQQVALPLLQLWTRNFKDPVLSLAVVDVFGSLAAVPAARPALQGAMYPALVDIVGKPEEKPAELVEGALDLAVALLQPSTSQSAAAVHSVFTGTVMRLLHSQEDAGVLQSCCHYLRVLIAKGGESVFSHGGSDPDAAIRDILAGLQRLLLPGKGDSVPLFVGQVLLSILRALPQRAAAAMADIMPAVTAKLAAATYSPLIVALLTVFAQLVHTNAVQLVDYLAAAPAPGGHGRALDLVLQIWTERALEFKGVHDIKLSTSALAVLLSTRHPALASAQVKGKRLDTESGIRTRSRAARQQEQWQWVPAPAKLFALLADTLIEAKEGKLGEAEDDDEWESVSGSEDESATGGGSVRDSAALGSIPQAILKSAVDDGSDDPALEEEGPFKGMDLPDFIRAQLESLAQQDRPLFETCCALLSAAQLQAVRSCLLP